MIVADFVSPAQGRVTSEWGPRRLAGRAPGFHRGIDIAPPIPGTRNCPVYAAYAGTVDYIQRNANEGRNAVTGTWNTGRLVVVKGKGGGNELYGHLDRIMVKVGQRVEAGQQIGTMGETGNVTGIHLHFECWNGRTQGGGNGAGNTRNPRIDFERHGIVPGSAPIIGDEFDMASLDELRKIVREEVRAATTVTLTDSAMAAIVTSQRVWDFSDIMSIIAHRTGFAFQRTGTIRADVRAVLDYAPGE